MRDWQTYRKCLINVNVKEENTSNTGYQYCTNSSTSDKSNALLVTMNGPPISFRNNWIASFIMLQLENFKVIPLQVRLPFIGNSVDQVLLSLHLQCLNYLRNNRQSQKILTKIILDKTDSTTYRHNRGIVTSKNLTLDNTK